MSADAGSGCGRLVCRCLLASAAVTLCLTLEQVGPRGARAAPPAAFDAPSVKPFPGHGPETPTFVVRAAHPLPLEGDRFATQLAGAAAALELRLDGPDGSHAAILVVPRGPTPLGFKRATAFYRLSRAIRFGGVPPTALLHVALGTLVGMTSSIARGGELFRGTVPNADGTVDALYLECVSRDSFRLASFPSIGLHDGASEAMWERRSVGELPANAPDRTLLGSYFELLVLDYLSANCCRREAKIHDGRLVPDNNSSAFPPHPDRDSLDKLLRKIRRFRHVSADVVQALLALSPERSRTIFASGDFEDALLTPRELTTLDERRRTLVSLFEGTRDADAGAPDGKDAK